MVEDDLPDELTPTELFARRLRELRKRRDWSAQKLADRIAELEPGSPLSRGTIAKIESGKRGVWLDEVFLVAAALGVPPGVLYVSRPDDPWQVRLGGERSVSSHEVWRWVEGSEPLPGDTPGGQRFFHRVLVDLHAVEAMQMHYDMIKNLENRLWMAEHEEVPERHRQVQDAHIAQLRRQLEEARQDLPQRWQDFRRLNAQAIEQEVLAKETLGYIEDIARDLGVDPDEVD